MHATRFTFANFKWQYIDGLILFSKCCRSAIGINIETVHNVKNNSGNHKMIQPNKLASPESFLGENVQNSCRKVCIQNINKIHRIFGLIGFSVY